VCLSLPQADSRSSNLFDYVSSYPLADRAVWCMEMMSACLTARGVAVTVNAVACPGIVAGATPAAVRATDGASSLESSVRVCDACRDELRLCC
jgi:hypothetical protein